MKTLIVDIKRNALDDGPGIRTLIFFKGCPLSCVWCQNPETKKAGQELSFTKEDCSECTICMSHCKKGAINFSNQYRIDRDICDLCGKCIEVCPNQAYKYVGKEYDIKELAELILRDKVFYDNTGGGVTLSGGEPTFHMEYLNALLKELKNYGIHICIETSGYYNNEKFIELVLPFLDLIYFDLKIYDSNLHEKYCNVPNELILSNFEYLIKNESIELLPRIPLIPKITLKEENLRSWIQYFKSLNIDKVWLLPYNPLWLSKSEKIGLEPEYNHSEWLTIDTKRKIKSLFRENNIKINDF